MLTPPRFSTAFSPPGERADRGNLWMMRLFPEQSGLVGDLEFEAAGKRAPPDEEGRQFQ